MNQEESFSQLPPEPQKSAVPNWIKGVVLVSIGVAGGLIAGKYVYAPEPAPSSIIYASPTPTSLPAEAPVKDGDPTANWKTYTNTTYQYAIKYPSTWRTVNLAAGATGKEAPSEATNLQIVEINPSANIPDENTITIQVLQTMPGYPSEWTKSQVVIGKINMTRYDITLSPILDTVIYLLKTPDTKNFIEIHFPFKSGNESILKTFDQILSTFKFMDQNTSYECPPTEWVDCMPGPGVRKVECGQEYLQWAQTNCPNFKGAAY